MSQSRAPSTTGRSRKRFTADAVVAAAASDSFAEATVQAPVLAFLAVYLAAVLLQGSSTTPLAVLPTDNTSTPDMTNAAHAANGDSLAVGAGGAASYESPEGLRMPLRGPFPPALLSLHYLGGVALVVLAVLQKLSVTFMAARNAEPRRRWWRWAHRRVLGPLTTVAMAAMAFGGFALRHASDLPHFEAAMVGFVAPWLIFLSSLWATAWLRWFVVHAVIGDLTFKACVAVPLARVLGVVLQRLDPAWWLATGSATVVAESLAWVPLLPFEVTEVGVAAHAGFTAASGYYSGIALASVVTAAWAIYDIVGLVRRLNAVKLSPD